MIEVKNVSMDFEMANDNIFSLKEYIVKSIKGEIKKNRFRVLDNINFKVEKGDIVGILGKNGAGKSTLLKIISGIITPTEGQVIVNGNIVPMLELGSGFDYDLSGRENIYLNGAILGYSKKYIDSIYEEVIKFSELGEFINMPIRNYSSGMIMRLAFSIATTVKPEILIVDEILSVGDKDFQVKSKERMLGMMRGGTTVLFVSHDINQIRELCNKAIWLESGEIRAKGDANTVSLMYGGGIEE